MDRLKDSTLRALETASATISQVCKHINNKTLFSYEEEDYKIGN